MAEWLKAPHSKFCHPCSVLAGIVVSIAAAISLAAAICFARQAGPPRDRSIVIDGMQEDAAEVIDATLRAALDKRRK
jgi:hypothetical protein